MKSFEIREDTEDLPFGFRVITLSRKLAQSASSYWWQQVFSESRTRILICYIILMSISTLVSVLLVRHILLVRLGEQIQQSLELEIEEFQQLRGGNDPETGQPFSDDIEAIFDVFLARNITEDDEFFVTISNGQFYRASSLALPDSLQPNSPIVQYWATLRQPQQGVETVPSSSSKKILYEAEPARVFYYAEPISIAGQTKGVFVVAHIPSLGKQSEINAAVRVIIKVSLIVLAIASLLAWFVAGQVLAPLRLLSRTARSISEANLTERISVQGKGDLAELATTFNDMMDRIEATFNSQRQLFNDVGHELRTPITIIRGHLELIGLTPDDQQETIDIVLDELDRMSRFINELVLLAKVERPDFLLPETLDLQSFTEEVYAKMKTLADRNWQLEAVGSGSFTADRQRLTEAIINLAQNATQHTETGDAIAFGSAQSQGQVYLWIRDTGEGISFEDQQRIFERFVRGNSRYHRSEGSGLGLSIVQAIAQAHGGRVDLHSQPDKGAIFTLVLPLGLR